MRVPGISLAARRRLQYVPQAMDGYDEPTLVEKTAGSEDTTVSDRERAIIDACKWRNLEQLRIIAESPGGFLTDNLRQLACKHLIISQPSSHTS